MYSSICRNSAATSGLCPYPSSIASAVSICCWTKPCTHSWIWYAFNIEGLVLMKFLKFISTHASDTLRLPTVSTTAFPFLTPAATSQWQDVATADAMQNAAAARMWQHRFPELRIVGFIVV